MDKLIGPYKIVRTLGAGGMGSVYEAIHTQLQRRAAIKVLHKSFQQDPEFLQRFSNEARAVNIINHPNIVSIVHYGSDDDGSPYIVMEYLEGESLRQRMSRSGRMEQHAAMRIGKQVASGLAAAHAKQVVHRDLKPVNVMLISDPDTPDGERVKILDFGIAKVAAAPGDQALTRVGTSLGTPAYMSPEQCKSARDVSDRSDVYSLGIILFEILAGEHPFSEARADSAMMASHIGRPAPSLDVKAPEVSGDLVALVNRMLAKQPDARPSSAEVAAILGRLSGTATGMLQVIPLPAEGTDDSGVLEGPRAGDAVTGHGKRKAATPQGFFAGLQGKLKDTPPIIIGAAVVLVLGLGCLIFFVRLLLEAPPERPDLVQWTIDSEPAGAEVLDATGQVLGQTPLKLSRPRKVAVETLSLRREGYAEQRVPLDGSHDDGRVVVLTALAKPPPNETPESPAKSKPDGPAKGKRSKKKQKTESISTTKSGKRHHRAP